MQSSVEKAGFHKKSKQQQSKDIELEYSIWNSWVILVSTVMKYFFSKKHL